MAAIIHMFYSFDFGLHIWEQRINILSGFFLGLAIYSYFYRKKVVKKEIIKLKRDAIILENLKNNLILKVMEGEKFTIKEMVINMSNDFKEFKIEIRQDIKELVSLFHSYEKTNEKRISDLEGNQKLTKKTIAMYVGFIGIFIMIVINTYMSFKG